MKLSSLKERLLVLRLRMWVHIQIHIQFILNPYIQYLFKLDNTHWNAGPSKFLNGSGRLSLSLTLSRTCTPTLAPILTLTLTLTLNLILKVTLALTFALALTLTLTQTLTLIQALRSVLTSALAYLRIESSTGS